jgi:hypothetical protein
MFRRREPATDPLCKPNGYMRMNFGSVRIAIISVTHSLSIPMTTSNFFSMGRRNESSIDDVSPFRDETLLPGEKMTRTTGLTTIVFLKPRQWGWFKVKALVRYEEMTRTTRLTAVILLNSEWFEWFKVNTFIIPREVTWTTKFETVICFAFGKSWWFEMKAFFSDREMARTAGFAAVILLQPGWF